MVTLGIENNEIFHVIFGFFFYSLLTSLAKDSIRRVDNRF